MTDIHSRFVHALRTQKTAENPKDDVWICPYCPFDVKRFQNEDKLFCHVSGAHPPHSKDRAQITLDAKRAKSAADQASDITVGGSTTPDVGTLSLGPVKPSKRSPVSKKRSAGSDIQARRGKVGSSHPEIYDPEISRDIFPKEYNSPGELHGPNLPAIQYEFPREPSNHGPKEASRSWPHSSRSRSSPSGYGNTYGAISPRNHAARSQNKALPPLNSPSQRLPGLIELPRYDPRYPDLLLQPDSKPISQDQLASEVKSIYTGLTMVENKCIEVDQSQKLALDDAEPGSLTTFPSDHWQALIALHRTLLHEHHDFFLASQHPSASPALRRLASKYSMPARMWKHGIHQFLELLRRNLPGSMDYMLAFIYLAYQMVALLYETVPAFEDTWIECLGDLGRYRMAIEDDDIRDRDTWASVARSWYSKAADKNPATGRLYHHLAILARSNPLLQLCYYSKSLTSVITFSSARDSILTSLDPVLEVYKHTSVASLPVDTVFIVAHATLFKKLSPEQFERAQHAFLSLLDSHIGAITAKWKEQGIYIAIINLAGLFDYGSNKSFLKSIVHYSEKVSEARSSLMNHAPSPSSDAEDSPSNLSEADIAMRLDQLANDFTFSKAYVLTMRTFSLALRRIGDKNVLPHIHVVFAFLLSFASMPYVSKLIDHAPWAEIASFLNALIKSELPSHDFSGHIFSLDQPDTVPLPDDYWIRGQLWSESYFPDFWFAQEHDEDDRYLELASTNKCRTERILNIGHEISKFGRWISYDQKSHTFSAFTSRDST